MTPLHRKRRFFSGTRRTRQGSSTPEVALAFIVSFAFAITLYVIAMNSFGNLYQVISVFTGHPYL